MPKYRLTLRRVEYSSATVDVEADTAKQAKQRVWELEGRRGGFDFEYTDNESEVDECVRVCPSCENIASFSCEDCDNCDGCCECGKDKCTSCGDRDPLCGNCGRCGYCCKREGCKQLAGIVELDVHGNAVNAPADEQGFVDGGIPSNE